MGGLYFFLPTLLVVFLSFLIVRAAAIALMMTGMDEKRARFQALSAFSGTGFTTKEAEFVVNNPLRRRIISWLMILGNAGIVTVIVTATSSLVTQVKGIISPSMFLSCLQDYM
jgi:Trk-type K+ transport system membrane component